MSKITNRYHELRWDVINLRMKVVTTFKNLFLYRKVLANHPPHALYFSGMMEMLHFQLGIALERRYDHPWADKATIPELQRFRELLKHCIDNDYIDRCGGVDHTRFNRFEKDSQGKYLVTDLRTFEEKQRDDKVLAEAKELKAREHGELMLLFGKGLTDELDRPF